MDDEVLISEDEQHEQVAQVVVVTLQYHEVEMMELQIHDEVVVDEHLMVAGHLYEYDEREEVEL